jgi:5-(aminomethyl)-3-furanmethanol phosphate kinase
VSEVRVIKLGGSLLDWSGLAAAWRAWHARQPPMADLIIVGGGELVESIRRFDAVHNLSDRTAHWLAIDAMSVTARMVAVLLPEARLIKQLDSFGNERLQILDVRAFVRQDAEGDDALPESWDVTSDSIAARAADRIQAAELVLLKSALPESDRPTDPTMSDLAAQGYVDAFLPKCVASDIPIRYVNLRDVQFEQVIICTTREVKSQSRTSKQRGN